MAMKFFYVCAGILLVAMSYNVESMRAEAQSGNLVGGVRFGATIGLVASSGGDVYRANHATNGGGASWTMVGHISSSSPIVAIGNESDLNVLAYAENGDFFSSSNFGGSWQFRGNVFGAVPVTAQPESWGKLKDRYRK